MSTEAIDHGKVGADPDRTYFEKIVRIPGEGEAPNRCRDYHPIGFCDIGHVVLGRSSCGTRGCPDHWRDWLEDSLVNQIARMAAFRYSREGAEKRCSHVVASPPADKLWSTDRLWAEREGAREALRASGIDGGVMVTHPYRTNERGDRLFDAAVSAGAVTEDTGKWEFLRKATDGWEELQGYIRASPHYHTLAAGADIDGSLAPEGWVVERIRTFDRFYLHDLESYKDMVASGYYILTHAAVQEGRHTVSYFGDVHPSNFDPSEELTNTAWEVIKRYAEKAVKGEDEELGEMECPVEDCEASVHDLIHIYDFVKDENWMERIRLSSGGRERWLQMRGLRAWSEGRTDNPPPHARGSKDGFRSWLAERGRVFSREAKQVGLPV